MKRCTKCFIEKDIDLFYKHKDKKYGRLSECKECTKERVRKNKRSFFSHKNSYDKTEKGVIRVIYKTQRGNSKRRGHSMPEYSKEELKEWLYNNGFKVLYEEWVKSGFKKDKKPSVDRIDDFKGYSFGNIKLGTYLENREHQYIDILTGHGTSGKRCKPIICFDSNRILIAEYVSYSAARRTVGYSFEKVIGKNKKDRTKGYIWKYKRTQTNTEQ